MRLDRHFREIEVPKVSRDGATPMMSLYAFCPAGSGPANLWAEVYRQAYLQTVEALKPTRYDRALAAPVN
jgi:hypothetical protein